MEAQILTHGENAAASRMNERQQAKPGNESQKTFVYSPAIARARAETTRKEKKPRPMVSADIYNHRTSDLASDE
jgi:hypothetical protein